jgi:SAM-dependent methyltransferase
MTKTSLKDRIRKIGGKYSRKILPKPIFTKILKLKIKLIGRAYIPGETSKAKKRRLKEGFFEKYTKGKGLDIGFGGDPITSNVMGYDFEHGDALYLDGLKSDEKFDFVYSSHCLEHMPNPGLALKKWWERVKKGGYLIIYLPHRDLFEKKKTLPSRYNQSHFHFYLPDKDEAPNTLGLRSLIEKSLSGYKIIYIKTCDEGYKSNGPVIESEGEYSIEAVIKKA